MLYQHEWQGNYIWLCRGKNALFAHTILVETWCTSKLLQGEMSIIDRQHDLTIHENMPVVAVAFDITVFCVDFIHNQKT